jgi:hypothetical protein
MLLDAGGAHTPIGARLLLDLELEPGRSFRALGVVRRLASRHGRPHAGIEFVELPEPTLDALSTFTLDRL